MGTIRLVAAALGVLMLVSTADAEAARRRDRHPGHQPRVKTATYTVPARPPVRILRTTERTQAPWMARNARMDARMAQAAHARQAGRAPTVRVAAAGVRTGSYAQAGRHHGLLRGS